MRALILAWICLLVAGIGNQVQAAKPVEVDGLFYEITGTNTVRIVGSGRNEAALVIPEQVTIKNATYIVTAVGTAFAIPDKNGKIKQTGWGMLQKVVIPNTVTRLEPYAFAAQAQLSEVQLPESLRVIGQEAFAGCTSLKAIDIPNGVTEIQDRAFAGCKIFTFNLRNTQIRTFNLNCLGGAAWAFVALPKGVTQFTGNGNTGGAFFYMDYASLEALSKGGFREFLESIQILGVGNTEVYNKIYLPNLRMIVLADGIKEIGERAFDCYQKLGKVYLNGFSFEDPATGKSYRLGKSDITVIGDHAFYLCQSLTGIALPSSLERIESHAFDGCHSLKSISLPLFLNYIGECAFWSCEQLEQVKGLNNSITYGYYNGLAPFDYEFHFEEVQKTFSYFALGYLKKELEAWEQKKEFETTAQWQQRVTVENRENRVDELIEQAKKEFVAQAEKPELNVTLGSYDADYHNFRLDAGELGYVYVQVPLGEAPAFKANFSNARLSPAYGVKDDRLALVGMEVILNGKTYKNLDAVPDDNRELLAQLPPLSIDLGGENTPVQQGATPAPQPKAADVDMNIPETGTVADKTFAVVIANEEYSREARVPFALRDGEVFAEYCRKTLGIPEKNIRVVKNATLNDMKFQLNWLSQVLGTYHGAARAIVYYAGHGIPDEADKGAYLLPVDGYGSDVSTGFSLKDFYGMLSAVPSESVAVFLDACFSGTKRESGMLASARGVAIKVRDEAPQGNLVVFTAAQGDETAYQYAEKGHGMFTYFLLKKLQESKGDVTLGELGDYITNEVKRESLLNNNKIQTPTVIPATGMTGWRGWKLK